MTKLAEFIVDKLQQDVVAQKRKLIDAKQRARLTQIRVDKAVSDTMSSPQGMLSAFLFGALSAKYGRIGALRKLVLLQRVAQGLI
ncbi:hypothetical protein EAG18_10705 [Pseudoalteromonas sp. J010]|uniref:hypothetical protein n=1 Tax=Pseudoalteromonas sp. J010 TaxID=998465 RepID=UPI000F64A3A3|nr:hypothetical protein [Pseudoalteromonas sp. J010]RRS08659.1 hypothetical protein EAG18_10705 [Pseudoalteromonas sp. J010]